MATRTHGVLCLSIVALIVLLAPLPASASSTPTITTMVTSATNSTITLGDTVTFTATVTGSGGTPIGLVTFFDGSVPLGSGTLSLVGGAIDQATFSTSLLSLADVNPPPHSISAVYDGDA